MLESKETVGDCSICKPGTIFRARPSRQVCHVSRAHERFVIIRAPMKFSRDLLWPDQKIETVKHRLKGFRQAKGNIHDSSMTSRDRRGSLEKKEV